MNPSQIRFLHVDGQGHIDAHTQHGLPDGLPVADEGTYLSRDDLLEFIRDQAGPADVIGPDGQRADNDNPAAAGFEALHEALRTLGA